MKVSVDPFLSQSLKWVSPGSKFIKGLTVPSRYVDPNIGIWIF